MKSKNLIENARKPFSLAKFVPKKDKMFETIEGHVDCNIIRLKPFTDKRGSLCFAEGEKDIPFDIKRVFWIYGVPAGAERGGHAHWKCSEAIFPVSGSFEIYIDDGTHHHVFTLTSPDMGIIVKAGVWCVLRNFSKDTVCVVAASMEYDETGYVNDYQTYLKEVRCRQ
jgi:uncharacterized RmlC-like cupin family protein